MEFNARILEDLTLAAKHQDYDQSLQNLLSLSPALADFFASVFVMADDLALRQNRLNLLQNLHQILQTVVHIG
jgi:glycyl-tRNA synthetase beta chain